MDNQHRLIKGYGELMREEIDAINAIKTVADSVGKVIKDVEQLPCGVDMRWVAIARTELQQGFMALARAVARPEGF